MPDHLQKQRLPRGTTMATSRGAAIAPHRRASAARVSIPHPHQQAGTRPRSALRLRCERPPAVALCARTDASLRPRGRVWWPTEGGKRDACRWPSRHRRDDDVDWTAASQEDPSSTSLQQRLSSASDPIPARSDREATAVSSPIPGLALSPLAAGRSDAQRERAGAASHRGGRVHGLADHHTDIVPIPAPKTSETSMHAVDAATRTSHITNGKQYAPSC